MNSARPSIHPIRLRLSNCYLVAQEGLVLVDCGLRGEAEAILRGINRLGFQPAKLRLVVLTHGHGDHAGSALELSAETGAPIALHAADASYLSAGMEVPAPPVTSWARLLAKVLSVKTFGASFMVDPFTPEILLTDADFPLEPYGVSGKIVHTPGHTAGSVSLVLESGEAIVGDLAMNGLPSLRFKPELPMIAQDMRLLSGSWKRLVEGGITTVYPGHGSPFPAGALREAV